MKTEWHEKLHLKHDQMLAQKRAGMSAREIADFHGINKITNVYSKIRKAIEREALKNEANQTNA